MTKPKKSGEASPKKRNPRRSEDGLFPGKSDEDILAALLTVPPINEKPKKSKKD